MIPNCLALYIVLVTIFLGTAIVAEAPLSFLGIGVPPDVASWGGMLNGAAQTYVQLAPWLGVFPGLAIAIVVFAWNLLGMPCGTCSTRGSGEPGKAPCLDRGCHCAAGHLWYQRNAEPDARESGDYTMTSLFHRGRRLHGYAARG